MIITAMALVLLSAPPASGAEPDPRIEAARAALASLEKGLKSALQEAMQTGGPVAAIGACHEQAARIAAAASTKVAVGRTSHKLRNPANAPAPWMVPLLAELRAASAKPGDFRTATLPDGALGYVEPIRVGPVCLACHGATVVPDVAAKLKALYPKDAATGFAPGDFRGLFWAVVPPGP